MGGFVSRGVPWRRRPGNRLPETSPYRVTTIAALAILMLCIGSSTGCTSEKKLTGGVAEPARVEVSQLTSFKNCTEMLFGLRTAAIANIDAWAPTYVANGTTGDKRAAANPPDGAAPAAGGAENSESTSGSGTYSGTNTHEAGVDEPDIVKTDGKRIITISGDKLVVVDATSRSVTKRVDLGSGSRQRPSYGGGEMLMSGDRVLLIDNSQYTYAEPVGAGRAANTAVVPEPDPLTAPQLTLVDIGAQPRVVARYTMDGAVIDSRQVGSTVRVVVRSTPHFERPTYKGGSADTYAAAMAHTIQQSALEEWLPRFAVVTETGRTTGRVDCSAVARPVEYTANNMLTLLTFDLAKGELGTGEPLTVAADGNTVYSNGPALYVANDQRWRETAAASSRTSRTQRTEIYKFDTSKPGQPSFVAGGVVDGWLLNQYSMSEWGGHLRIATTGTTGSQDAATSTTESSVYVLQQDGGELKKVGQVGGLGKGERIYSVRFVGPLGYVVTFRQTDPLYTVDLHDPKSPRVTGELKITGYSAYLHPAGEGRLIGIGQEATDQGRTQGTQVSLFDVSDVAAPKRLAQYHMAAAHSEAEYDPHAFMYWQQTGLLVVPMTKAARGSSAKVGALILRVADGSITELAFIQHPGTAQGLAVINRSLIIDETLWTLSAQGLLASDMRTAAQQAWVPL